MADRQSSSASSRRSRSGDDAIGQFVIGAEIGKGSFAQVYMGKHKSSGAAVAIKSVELSRLNKKLKENLYSEIKILKHLRHPHIVALHDCIESGTHINLIMEYCELGDLSLFIKKREKLVTNPATHDMARKYPNAPNAGLNEVVIRHFLKQLASALQFLRQANLVHRDVKPQNLLLLPSPEYRETNRAARPVLSASQDSLIPVAGLPSLPMLKLADFGFARVLPSTSLAETLCGSPLYMAPEILRYERYDAKADLWSVGTVLYEMVAGKPPFRASNHVELLRKIEAAEDQIRFPRESIVSADMKALIRSLLKRNPIERLSFENFFKNVVITGPIPGLVEDDIPKPEPRSSRELRAATKSEEPVPSPRRLSIRRYPTEQDNVREEAASSPREKHFRSSPLSTPVEEGKQLGGGSPRLSYSPRHESGEGLGIRRPQAVPSTSAPTRPGLYEQRRRGASNASQTRQTRETPSPVGSVTNEQARVRTRHQAGRTADEQEKAAQDVAFERDYVVVEKKHVEVNAFADGLANGMLAMQGQSASPKSGQMVRRVTTQGAPESTTGAVPPTPSRAMQIAQGKQRPNAHDRQSSLGGSPGSTASFISKAIQDASLRLLGVKYAPPLIGKGPSPPQFYSPFPAYPTPSAPVGLIGDGKQSAPIDEDSRVAQCIEDLATRSDVVYGFAEVKYKQLVPLAPSMDHGLGGVPADKMATEEEDVLTVEAIVVLSEEALVLYVKALSLLAKSMDIASLWWARKNRDSSGNGHSSARESSNSQSLAYRINSAVQWIRTRFNEVLEKAEIARLKLLEAQQRLPEDHPSHPNNHPTEATSISASGAEGVFLTVGISAEKLMYDRALEMSRTAAINEIANEDLAGCEISYVTAIRMLEAVLDNDDEIPKRRASGSQKDERGSNREQESTDLNPDDQQTVQKMIHMITSRLANVRKKMHMIANASKAQQQQQSLARRRSGDVTPRSVQSHAS
ncbi:Serine/threonine-protein kinase ATG1 [Pleurostoma richardsiae]|uniref:non-specific serine/threonine protein kinase n=1 Tax=Pleurostoma richardsiae TaxID=41990 RepID=A0AA38VV83_9PEZI|nr:Serine/threonine-protein kinase ATG1 [Pleurostoma richardsiae]